MVVLTFAGPAVAQTANPPSGRPLLGKVLTQVARDFVALPSRATFTVLGIGGATALGAGQGDRHVNLSDVIFGAALGIAAGRTIAGLEFALTWIPVVTPTRVAVMVTYAR